MTLALLALAVLLIVSSSSRADLLVSSYATGQVMRYDEVTGEFRGVFSTCLPDDHPMGLAIGPDENLYVSERVWPPGAPLFTAIRRFDGTTGAFLNTFISNLDTGGYLEFGPDGNLYIAYGDRIRRYDGATGEFIDDFTEVIDLYNEFRGFSFGPDGDLFVVHNGGIGNRVLRYDGSTGAFLGEFSRMADDERANDLVFGPDGNLYVFIQLGDQWGYLEVLQFDAVTGERLGAFVPQGDPIGQGALVFGPDGNLYVSTGNVGVPTSDSVLRFDGATGQLLDSFVSSGSGGLSNAADLVFAPRLCNQFGSYGSCAVGAGTRCRTDGPREVGKDLARVSRIDVLDCGPADGVAGFQVSQTCPPEYAYCVESHNDGVGNRVKLGVIESGGEETGKILVNDPSDILHESGCATVGTGTCTLRDAITYANAHAGPDEVDFSIAGTGVHTIVLDSNLPEIAGDVTIDGYTQPGASPNTNGGGLGDNAALLIEINGNGKGCFGIGGVNTTIRGLVINRCVGPAVATSFINATGPIHIEGNFIGTDPSGVVSLPNAVGVSGGTSGESFGGDFIVGGATPETRNLISGNTGAGVVFAPVEIGGPNVIIRNNQIGTTAMGTAAMANGGSGVDLVVGIPVEISDNVVSGNAAQGITLRERGLFSVVNVHGNLIGTDVSGASRLGNQSSGIRVFEDGDSPSAIVIIGNTIAFNGAGDPIGGGIVYFSGSHHWYTSDPKVLGNSIFENTSDGSGLENGLGIDLVGPGPTSNNHCNGSEEGQPQQNYPVLSSAASDGSTIRIQGGLDSGAATTYRIEFFASPSCDPSGYGEGKAFIGSTDVTTDGSCNAAFDITLPVAVAEGQFITATATDRSTSEFSLCVPVTEVPSPPEIVNDLVRMTGLTQQRSTTPVPGGPAGTLMINATFKNTSTSGIEAPYFTVTALSGGNLLLNADGGPGGVGSKLTAPMGGGGVLEPGVSFTTSFVIGLQTGNRFNFFVDLWGEPTP